MVPKRCRLSRHIKALGSIIWNFQICFSIFPEAGSCPRAGFRGPPMTTWPGMEPRQLLEHHSGKRTEYWPYLLGLKYLVSRGISKSLATSARVFKKATCLHKTSIITWAYVTFRHLASVCSAKPYFVQKTEFNLNCPPLSSQGHFNSWP